MDRDLHLAHVVRAEVRSVSRADSGDVAIIAIDPGASVRPAITASSGASSGTVRRV